MIDIFIIVPLAIIAVTLITLLMSPRGRGSVGNQGDQNIENRINVTAHTSRILAREAVKIALRRYLSEKGDLNNLPLEVEIVYSHLMIAVYRLNSYREKEVVSGLQTLVALGTNDLLEEYVSRLENLRSRWIGNKKIEDLLTKSTNSMSENTIDDLDLKIVPKSFLDKIKISK